MQDLTQDDLSKLLGIGKPAVLALTSLGKIPYKVLSTGEYRFCPDAISRWVVEGTDLTTEDDFIENLRKTFLEKYPSQMKAIREFGEKFPDLPKGYYLHAESHKQLGQVWHARFYDMDKGILLPLKRSTYTNNREAAEKWAAENRESIIAEYYGEKTNTRLDLYETLDKYYENDSPFLKVDIDRGRTLSEKKRQIYDGFLKNKLVPFLKGSGVKDVGEVTTPLLTRFQNHLRKTIKPQTVNHYMCGLKVVFDHLVIHGYTSLNPCKSLSALGVRDSDTRATGCYEIGKLKGIFNRRWDNALHHLLSLLIYTTNMRNSEISRLQISDIVEIGGEKFIHIPKSKTPNGERRIPLHPFVHKKIMDYAGDNDYVFSNNGKKGRWFERACTEAKFALAEHLGYTPEMLERENIKFYSGRHFWKTLMSSEGLGENIEKFFMGHKVSGNIADNYNHYDRVGSENLAKKAREVFAALDRCLLTA